MPIDSSVQDLDGLVAASAAVRRPFEWQGYLNLAFYAGNQWCAWDGSMLWNPSLEGWREKVTDNRIAPIVRTEIAKMTKTRPQWVGIPRTQSDRDVGAARYAELALEDAWKRQGMLRKLRAALLWSRTTGAGFWKVWWDPTIGAARDVLVYKDGHPQAGKSVKDSNGAPLSPEAAQGLPSEMADMVTTRQVAMGDLCVELRTFFEVYPDPLCGEEGIESAEWIAEESVYSRDYMARHFPEDVDKLAFDAEPSAGISESRMPGFPGTAGPELRGNARGCKVREYWSPERHVIWSGQTILQEEDNPYPWLPYVMFRGIPVPGRLWPDCVVTQLRPRQTDLNKRLSQIAENAERIANPPLLVPTTIGDEFVWEGLPGERIDYPDTGSPNAAPRFLEVPEMKAYVQADIDRTERSIMEISGQHEVSGGQVPAGVTAASAINLLQEQDDTRLGPDIADMEEALTHAGRRILWFIRRYYTDQRHLLVAGEDGRWDVEAFKGDMLEGAEDIEVQAGSGMPQSKAAKQAAIETVLNLFIQNQIPLSERHLRKVLSEYQVGGLEQFFASQGRDEQQIQEENRRMALGEGAGAGFAINSFDNDSAHIEGHQDFQKTARYSELVARNPAVGDVFEAHVAAHRDRMDKVALAGMQQLQLQAPANGAGNGATPQLPPATSQTPLGG